MKGLAIAAVITLAPLFGVMFYSIGFRDGMKAILLAATAMLWVTSAVLIGIAFQSG